MGRRYYATQFGVVWSFSAIGWRKTLVNGLMRGTDYVDLDDYGKRIKSRPAHGVFDGRMVCDWVRSQFADALAMLDRDEEDSGEPHVHRWEPLTKHDRRYRRRCSVCLVIELWRPCGGHSARWKTWDWKTAVNDEAGNARVVGPKMWRRWLAAIPGIAADMGINRGSGSSP